MVLRIKTGQIWYKRSIIYRNNPKWSYGPKPVSYGYFSGTPCLFTLQQDRPRFGPKEPEVVECDADQFLCSVDGEAKCIPSAYVCDEENDCDNGEDEAPRARCNSYAHEFESTVNVRLVDKEVEQWSNRNLEACLKQCIFAKDFVCRGVNYEAEEKQCVLLENNIGMLGSLEESFSWSYHERKETAVQCEESLRCRSIIGNS